MIHFNIDISNFIADDGNRTLYAYGRWIITYYPQAKGKVRDV